MFEMIASVFSGGLTGIFGSAVQKIGDYFQQKQEYAHEMEMRELDLKELEKEKEASIAKVEAQSEAEQSIQQTENEGAAWSRSYKHDSRAYAEDLTPGQNWLMVIVDMSRGMIRPFLTMYLAGVATYMVMKMNALVGGMESVNIEKVHDLWWQVTMTVLYIASTAITWWFGSRAKVNPAKKGG